MARVSGRGGGISTGIAPLNGNDLYLQRLFVAIEQATEIILATKTNSNDAVKVVMTLTAYVLDQNYQRKLKAMFFKHYGRVISSNLENDEKALLIVFLCSEVLSGVMNYADRMLGIVNEVIVPDITIDPSDPSTYQIPADVPENTAVEVTEAVGEAPEIVEEEVSL